MPRTSIDLIDNRDQMTTWLWINGETEYIEVDPIELMTNMVENCHHVPFIDRESFLTHVMKRALEYADEAEHQDGQEYWENNFKDVPEMLSDFVLYLTSTLEDKS
jgi:hypothetical protein